MYITQEKSTFFGLTETIVVETIAKKFVDKTDGRRLGNNRTSRHGNKSKSSRKYSTTSLSNRLSSRQTSAREHRYHMRHIRQASLRQPEPMSQQRYSFFRFFFRDVSI